MRRRSWPAALALGLVLAFLFLGATFSSLNSALSPSACPVLACSPSDNRRRPPPRGSGSLSNSLRSTARLVAPWLLAGGLSAITALPRSSPSHALARGLLSHTPSAGSSDCPSPQSGIYSQRQASTLATSSYSYHVALFSGTAAAILAIPRIIGAASGSWFARSLALVTLLVVALGTPLLALPWLLPGFDNLKPLGRVSLLVRTLAILAPFGLDAVTSWAKGVDGRAASIMVVLTPVTAIAATVVQLRLYGAGAQSGAERGVALSADATRRSTGARCRHPHSCDGWSPPGSTALVYPVETLLDTRASVQDGYGLPGKSPPAWRPRTFEHGVQQAVRTHSARACGSICSLEQESEIRDPPPSVDGSEAAAIKRNRLAPVYGGADGRVAQVNRALPRTYLVGRCDETRDSESALAVFGRAASTRRHPLF